MEAAAQSLRDGVGKGSRGQAARADLLGIFEVENPKAELCLPQTPLLVPDSVVTARWVFGASVQLSEVWLIHLHYVQSQNIQGD